ncbi:MAG: hypothetical protein ACYC96_06295 [Fimbriimonadaceae bacterium]
MNSTELATLPASIRQRLELARELEAQHRPAEAANVAQNALYELARTSPSLCAALMAGQLGHRGIRRRVVEQTVTLVPIQQTFFGFSIGVSYHPRTETKTYTEEIGFW